ncbi:MAG: hypothetical protein BRC36_18135 [Cyanobacteria bacterium QH_2_48_84]|nr:MAG: hypothetical protein BRC36_18135 [Cyanobacteria bacterium QH_2_48_84]
MPLVSLIDTPQPKGVGILASTGESRAFLGIAHPYLELILYITGLPKGRGLRPMIFGHLVTVFAEQTYWFRRSLPPSLPVHS